MAIKDWLSSMTSGGGKTAPRRGAVDKGLSVDDLITLERYDEALALLKKKVAKNKGDYRSRILLADLYLKTKKSGEAIEEYVAVADRYASEGFFDKGYALIAKLSRMLPHEDKLKAKMTALQRAKRLEHRRQVVVASLAGKLWAVEVGQHWNELIRGPLIEVLSLDQLKKLFPLLEFVRLEEGKTLVERGETKNMAFLILSGELAAQVQLAAGNTTDLRSFRGGDLVGDSALFQRAPWPATFRAKSACKLLGLTRAALQQVMIGEDDPKGFLDMIRIQGNDQELVESVRHLKATQPT